MLVLAVDVWAYRARTLDSKVLQDLNFCPKKNSLKKFLVEQIFSEFFVNKFFQNSSCKRYNVTTNSLNISILCNAKEIPFNPFSLKAFDLSLTSSAFI